MTGIRGEKIQNESESENLLPGNLLPPGIRCMHILDTQLEGQEQPVIPRILPTICRASYT